MIEPDDLKRAVFQGTSVVNTSTAVSLRKSADTHSHDDAFSRGIGFITPEKHPSLPTIVSRVCLCGGEKCPEDELDDALPVMVGWGRETCAQTRGSMQCLGAQGASDKTPNVALEGPFNARTGTGFELVS